LFIFALILSLAVINCKDVVKELTTTISGKV